MYPDPSVNSSGFQNWECDFQYSGTYRGSPGVIFDTDGEDATEDELNSIAEDECCSVASGKSCLKNQLGIENCSGNGGGPAIVLVTYR